MMLSVKSMCDRGFKVDVIHDRSPGYIKGKYTELPIVATTRVVVTLPKKAGCGELSAVGVSYCSLKNQYDRALGTRIALGRACKKLGLPTK